MKPIVVVVLLAIVALAVLMLSRRGKEGYADEKETIFVSVAAYRDARCMDTVRKLFKMAKHPSRIFVGICQQVSDDASEMCMPMEHSKNIRVVSVPHAEAKGPTWARAVIANQLYRGERYYLQIDSHTDPVQNYDELSIAELKACPGSSTDLNVLSHYPLHVDTEEKVEAAGVPRLCKSKWNTQGIPTFEAVILPAGKEPKRVPFTSGGFLFGVGETLVNKVGFDGTLDHLFQGEEFLFSARLYTHGVDVWTPRVNLVRHVYDRDGPRFWDDVDYKGVQAQTIRKVKRILGLEKPAMPASYSHGLGRQRSLESYWKFAGLDPEKKSSSSDKMFC